MQYKYWFSYAARVTPVNTTDPIVMQGQIEITRVQPIDGMMALNECTQAIGMQLIKQYNVPGERIEIQILNWRPFERSLILDTGTVHFPLGKPQ